MDTTRQKHILIVDDSLDQQLLLKTVLEARGYTTECTSNGEEALSILRSSKVMPQTILLDLNMPIMGGLDFFQLKQQDESLRSIPVVLMSGENSVELTHDFGLSEVVAKPLTISRVIDAIERHKMSDDLNFTRDFTH